MAVPAAFQRASVTGWSPPPATQAACVPERLMTASVAAASPSSSSSSCASRARARLVRLFTVPTATEGEAEVPLAAREKGAHRCRYQEKSRANSFETPLGASDPGSAFNGNVSGDDMPGAMHANVRHDNICLRRA